jgi:hypothetical protein
LLSSLLSRRMFRRDSEAHKYALSWEWAVQDLNL